MTDQTRWLGFVLIFGLMVMMLISGVVLAQPEQPEPTAQQQTQDAIIQGYFQGTATAQAGMDATATLEAAFSAAATATAQVSIAQTATLAAVFSAAQTATFEAANPDFIVDHLEVVSVEEFPLYAGPGRTSAYLAPNGERFAHYDGDEICIYTISGRQERCTSMEVDERLYGPDLDRITWSPDSRYLTMESFDFLRLLRDPDILILNADTGTLTNITNDNTDCSRIGGRETDCAAFHDLAPTWLPSGETLLFVRLSEVEGTWISTLYRINADGSGEERVRLLPVELFAYVLDISADGQHLAFNHDSGNERRDGLWVGDLEGGNAERVFEASERRDTPRGIAFSPDGEYLIIVKSSGFERLGRPGEPENSSYRVVSAAGGQDSQIIGAEGMVYGAGWSPYGSALAYVIFDPEERSDGAPVRSGLYLSPGPGERGRMVLPGFFVPPTSNLGQPLTWGANNTILLTEPGQERLFAVQLGEQ